MSIKGILIIKKTTKKECLKVVHDSSEYWFQTEYGVRTERKDTNQQLFIFIIN